MNIHNPTSQQMYALNRVFAVPGDTWPNDIPRATLNECIHAGWIDGDDTIGYTMTTEGHTAWRSRR